jgi:hypothetical protein
VVVDAGVLAGADTAVDVEEDGADSCDVRWSNAYFQKLLLLIGRLTLTPLRALTFIAAALILACVPCMFNIWFTAVRCTDPSRCDRNAFSSCRLTGFFFV